MFDYSNHYVGYYNDENILKLSSSGGIFSALAQVIFLKKGIVFGAAYNHDLKRVEHICAESFDQLKPIRKSKYVWSEFRTCFKHLEKAINENRYILFTGTPCQAKVIRNKYGHYDKLIIADIFCHGTAEARFFTDYINFFCDDATGFDFRGQSSTGSSNYIFNVFNDKTILLSDSYNENVFTKLFINSAILRNSCFNCVLSTDRHSYSDVTMGDYTYDFNAKGNITVLHPSILSVNTKRGVELLEQARMFLYYEPLHKKEEIAYYYRDHKKVFGHWGYNKEIKEKFLSDYEKYGFKEAAVKNAFPKELSIVKKAAEMSKKNIIALYGCGNIGKYLYKFIKNYYSDFVKIKMFIVTDKSNCPASIDDIPVYSIDEIHSELKTDGISVIISVAEKFRNEIEVKLKSYGINTYI